MNRHNLPLLFHQGLKGSFFSLNYCILKGNKSQTDANNQPRMEAVCAVNNNTRLNKKQLYIYSAVKTRSGQSESVNPYVDAYVLKILLPE